MGRKRVVKAPDERRRELMDAARHLFITVGYEQTAVSDIVRQIGVAQGTFYWYFQSKEEVLQAIMKELADRWLAVVAEIAGRPELDAIGKFKTIEAEIFALALQEPDIIESFHLRATAAIHDRVNQEAAERLLPILSGIIRQGVDEGTFRVESPETAAFFLLAVVSGFFDRLTRGLGPSLGDGTPTIGTFQWPPPDPWPQLHRSMWEFLLRGLGVREPLAID